MKIRQAVLVSLLLFMASGCYGEMTGTVVDAETGAPIEGAVILVEWTVTKGVPGMRVTEKFKVIEKVTDKEGKVAISEELDPLVNPPRITIYKKGYVAWNNQHIFPTWKKRTDFRWTEGTTVKMEPFKREYSRAEHVYFLHSVTHWGELINEAFRWEELEREQKR